MKKNQRIPSEDIFLIAILAMAIIGILLMLSSCGWLQDARDAAEGAGKLGRTIKAADKDADGLLTTWEIIAWMLGGWGVLRPIETFAREALRRIRNGGGDNGSETCTSRRKNADLEGCDVRDER